MTVSTFDGAEHRAAYVPSHSDRAISTSRSALSSASPASRGEGSWLAALTIAFALLVLWAWLALI